MSASRKIRRSSNKNTLGNSEHGSGVVADITSESALRTALENEETPLVIDFWAPWCAPCRAMAPGFEAAATELAGKVRFAKINTESNPQLAGRFNISSIPALIVFDRGEVADSSVGLRSKAQIKAMLQRVLDKRAGIGPIDKLQRLFGKRSAA